MKVAYILTFALCIAFALAAPYTDEELKVMFEKFVRKYERVYADNDVDKRFGIFKENVIKAHKYNTISQDKVYGVTKFSDLTEQEFRSKYLMPPKTPDQMRATIKNAEVVESYTRNGPLPDSFDWREKGAVTPVKNQGSCGSCWAFSATGNLEGQNFLKHKKLVSLSEQNLVDCDHTCETQEGQEVCDSGCNGGLMWLAFQHVQNHGGIDSEESYAYEGYDDKCRFKNETVAVRVSGYKMLPTKDEELAAWLVDNGPVAVAVNAEWLQLYFGGVSNPYWCDAASLDHGVLLVGFGKSKTIFGHEINYWIVKNSWGDWGEKGTFRLAWGKCGINTVPSSAIVV
ncbi:cysteine proteinase [Acrasis kona]|uniref:Cysteine proteinase n=1 Tax=Acrasis kona TaxID=1008807 RepID=A0AAW2ZRY9_9EUKA